MTTGIYWLRMNILSYDFHLPCFLLLVLKGITTGHISYKFSGRLKQIEFEETTSVVVPLRKASTFHVGPKVLTITFPVWLGRQLILTVARTSSRASERDTQN